MAQVTIRINGFSYPVGCEDGQEQHLTEMAAEVDRRIASIKALGNQTGEARLLALSALLLADELHDTRLALSVGTKDGAKSAREIDSEGDRRRARLRRVAARAEEIAADLENS
jgi:cell division protein ZapA